VLSPLTSATTVVSAAGSDDAVVAAMPIPIPVNAEERRKCRRDWLDIVMLALFWFGSYAKASYYFKFQRKINTRRNGDNGG
jgi:hypothetical protein